jgi:lysophospholipase L1-like esterase
VLALDIAVWSFLRHRRLSGGRTTRIALGGATSLLIATLGGLLLQNFWAGRYPRLDSPTEAAWLEFEVKSTTGKIDREHGRAEPRRTRVLVVGTSQTWGAGATRVEDGFVEVLERLLALSEPERRWECINAGIQGLRSPRLLQVFREHWLALEPDILVVNLSNNDKDAEAFAQALNGFVDVAAEHGIRVLFSLEANSIERRPAPPMNATMRAVAEERGIPIVDVHGALARQYDGGFLWWDPVHPTTLGHRLIAETLLPAVLALTHQAE